MFSTFKQKSWWVRNGEIETDFENMIGLCVTPHCNSIVEIPPSGYCIRFVSSLIFARVDSSLIWSTRGPFDGIVISFRVSWRICAIYRCELGTRRSRSIPIRQWMR